MASIERELGRLEGERSQLEEYLSEQTTRFATYRAKLDNDPKLRFFARGLGGLDPVDEPVTDKGELEKTLDALWAEAGRHAHRARITFFFFRKRIISEAIGCIEQARTIVRQAEAAAPLAYGEQERELALRLAATIDAASPAIEAWREGLSEAAPPWDSELWSDWEPAEAIPYAVPFGTHRHRSTAVGDVSAASEWVLNAGSSLFLWKHYPEVVQQVQSLVLRILAQFPPGMARFVFVDPLGAGKSVAPFLHLADYDEGLVGGKVWSESTHIEERLQELQAHIEMVVQKYLRGQFDDIEAHNAAAGEIAEAYRFLVVFDFPAGFTESAAHRLVSITRNGPACGVYAIVLGAPGREMPYGFDGSELDGPATIFTRSGAGNSLATITGKEDVSPWQHELDLPPPLILTNPDEEKNLFTRVVSGIGARAKAATNVEVSEERLLELLETTLAAGLTEHQPVVERSPRLDDEDTWWTGDASLGIAVPIGRVGARAVQSLALVGTDTSVHALVAGKTGSGKSTLLHAAILNLCLLYSPEELELYLIDFKQGVEFKPYALASLPHARVVAIESEREFGLSVLRGLEREIAARGERFRAAGADDLNDYRKGTGETMPRVLLVADEFHVLFSDDDALANEAARILDALVRQGRSFGIHVILASQTISGVHQVGRGTMNQIAVRIALQCTESDSQVIFGEDNADARMLSRPGEAIYNSMNGLPEGNRRFQVVLLRDAEREQLLKRIGALAEKRGLARSPIVFEGNAQARLEENEELNALLRGEAGGAGSSSTPLRAWLGAPISLDGPVPVRFDRRAGGNLLFIGSESAVVDGALVSTIAGALPQVAAAGGSIEVVDFGGLDEAFAASVNEQAGLGSNVVRVGRRRQLSEVLGQLRNELEQRIESPALPGPPRLLVLHRLQSARDLDAGAIGLEGDGGPAEALAAILRDGPEFGIHVLASCDTATNLERRLEPSAQREFGMRLVTRMSENDSLQLIDVPDAAKLLGAQGIFSDEDRSERVKLRCYDFPPTGWLGSFADSPVWKAAGEQADPAIATD
ncbi:MAG TPA: FtsK/SpoIIIE domain-containing protein [Solirubrobacterales bacterium]|nr:FtsK/SpoIIIE domain-containing protein [Solirubrobacterales bacterium]